MGNKKITILLSILFIITFALGVVGYMNKDKESTNNGGSNVEVKTLSFSNKQIEVTSLYEKLSAYEFTKGVNHFTYAYIVCDIKDNEITYTVLKDAFGEEDGLEDVIYKLSAINNPVAAHAMVDLSQDGVLVKSYVLDSSNRLYLVKFLADKTKHKGFDITEYKVDNIEAFYEFDSAIFDEYSTEDTYVIFKTKDGSYYTDYLFDYTDVAITKLTSNEELELTEETQEEEEVNTTDENDVPVVNEGTTVNEEATASENEGTATNEETNTNETTESNEVTTQEPTTEEVKPENVE